MIAYNALREEDDVNILYLKVTSAGAKLEVAYIDHARRQNDECVRLKILDLTHSLRLD